VTCDRSVVFSGYSGYNKADRHNITEILLKDALNTITITHHRPGDVIENVKRIIKTP
jgi:hypothetical protein